MIDKKILQLAEKLWDYHHVDQSLERSTPKKDFKIFKKQLMMFGMRMNNSLV